MRFSILTNYLSKSDNMKTYMHLKYNNKFERLRYK